ncbi:hypothetical protein J1D01_10040 [Seonamhaeicola sp. NFXS20]|uniref:hypothetical protein n=1 Tax=unclassified Seonamhaeicola TaxID=2622645 RepID=UPI003564E044
MKEIIEAFSNYTLSVILVTTTPFAIMLNLIDGVFVLKTIPTIIATIFVLIVLQEFKSYILKINQQ